MKELLESVRTMRDKQRQINCDEYWLLSAREQATLMRECEACEYKVDELLRNM